MYKSAIPCLLLLLIACGGKPERAEFRSLSSPEGLAALNASFEKRVEKVGDNIHVAIGYGLANSIMIEGDDGLIIVDTMESVEAAQEVMAAFRAISDKPIAALIYTHNHADHVFGSGGFIPMDSDVLVIAHDTTSAYIDRIVNILRPIITTRSMRMFGNFLDDEASINDGIGPKLVMDEESLIDIRRPNRTFSDRLEITVAGVDLLLVHAPGETNDQIFVYLPKEKALLPGDNIYRTFPNLYTIRGTPYRPVDTWIKSLDAMRDLQPEVLIPSHTSIIRGGEAVQEALTTYRDGIQFVHDQTIRLMNHGLTPDQLVERIKLPPHLAESPYLQEYYGTVAWSVRSVYDGNLGWFDGNPTNLFPLPPVEQAQNYADLAGGVDRLRQRCLDAVEAGEHQWALELSDYLLALDPEDTKARDARVEALTALGESAGNPNARHYYLTRAAELGQGLKIGRMGKNPVELVHSFPMQGFFDSLRVRLIPEESLDVNQKVSFTFPDTKEAYTIHVRRGVAEIRQGAAEDADIRVTVKATVFKEMAAGFRGKAMTLVRDFDVEGGTFDLVGFFGMFESDEP